MLGGGVTCVWELGVVTLGSVGVGGLGVGGVGGSESVAGWSVVGLVVGVMDDLRWVGSSMRARWYLASCSGARVSSVMWAGSVVGLGGIVIGVGRGEVGSGGVAGGVCSGFGEGWLGGVSLGGRVSSVVGVGAVGAFGVVVGMGIGWSWAVCMH